MVGALGLGFGLIALCGLATMSLAGPQDYCDLLAKEAASRRIGHSDLITGTIDQPQANQSEATTSPQAPIWQSAYVQSFTACMSEYGAHIKRDTKSPGHARQSKTGPHRPTRAPSHGRTQRVGKPKPKAGASVRSRSAKADSHQTSSDEPPHASSKTNQNAQPRSSQPRMPADTTGRSNQPGRFVSRPGSRHPAKCFQPVASLCTER